MGIQIYDQVSILRSWSKVKLRCSVLLGFGLKELKIALNIVKVGVRCYLHNAHLHLWSTFNSEKLVKSETPSYGFAKVGVKGGAKRSESCESWSALLSIKWASKSMIKFNYEKIVKSETSSCIFARVRLKAVPNRSKHCKIWHAHLYINRESKSMIKFQFSEFGKKWNSLMPFR